MHTQKENTFSPARLTNARHRTFAVSLDDISSAIDFFREQVEAGTMKIFYLDVFNAGIKKNLHNGIDVTRHFNTGPGPISGHK